MNLTSGQIRNIIKEELQKLLQEQKSKESLITRLLGAYKNKTGDRIQALEDFLDFFESTEIGTYDNKFVYKWLKVLLSEYGAKQKGGLRKALQIRIPGSRIIVPGVKKRKNLDLVLSSGNYDNYVANYNKRAAKEEAKKAEEEAKAKRKAQIDAEEKAQRKKASDKKFRERLASIDKSTVDFYSGD